MPFGHEAYSLSTSVSDSFVVEGEFSAYVNDDLVYRDHNQLQAKGMWQLGKRMTGEWLETDPLSWFYTMKAATFQSFKTIGGTTFSPSPKYSSSPSLDFFGRDLPQITSDPNSVVTADSFSVTVSEGLVDVPSVQNEGIFYTVPPGLNGAYRHFGLYSKATFRDGHTEDTLFAYKYIDSGIAFPEGSGLRILWRILLTN